MSVHRVNTPSRMLAVAANFDQIAIIVFSIPEVLFAAALNAIVETALELRPATSWQLATGLKAEFDWRLTAHGMQAHYWGRRRYPAKQR